MAAIYFHRTNRCATCKKMSAYIEEAVKEGFAKETKGGQVSVSMIDFQDEKNKAYTEAYKITGPTLVLADVNAGKVTVGSPPPEVLDVGPRQGHFLQVRPGRSSRLPGGQVMATEYVWAGLGLVAGDLHLDIQPLPDWLRHCGVSYSVAA